MSFRGNADQPIIPACAGTCRERVPNERIRFPDVFDDPNMPGLRRYGQCFSLNRSG